MALMPTADEEKRSRREHEEFLKEELERFRTDFGHELGLAVFAYLYSEENEESDETGSLKRIALATTIATFATGTPEEISRAIAVLIFLNEQSAYLLQQKIDRHNNIY